MRYCIQINAAPEQEAALTALAFCQTLLSEKHHIERLFFYRQGVHLMSTLPISTSSTPAASHLWQTFIKNNQLDAVVCIGAALRRGVTDKAEATRYGLPNNNLSDQAALSGLGQWIEAVQQADRYVCFG